MVFLTSVNGLTNRLCNESLILLSFFHTERSCLVRMKGAKGKAAARVPKEVLNPADDRLVNILKQNIIRIKQKACTNEKFIPFASQPSIPNPKLWQ